MLSAILIVFCIALSVTLWRVAKQRDDAIARAEKSDILAMRRADDARKAKEQTAKAIQVGRDIAQQLRAWEMRRDQSIAILRGEVEFSTPADDETRDDQ